MAARTVLTVSCLLLWLLLLTVDAVWLWLLLRLPPRCR
jgi:hypothetical protein